MQERIDVGLVARAGSVFLQIRFGTPGVTRILAGSACMEAEMDVDQAKRMIIRLEEVIHEAQEQSDDV